MNNIYILKNKQAILSMYYNSKFYLIGFPDKKYANLVSRNIDYQSLKNVKIIKNSVLYTYKNDKIKMDFNTNLHIPKVKDVYKNNIYTESIPFEDFMSFPISLNNGICLPHYIIEESNDEFIFNSQIITSEN